MESTAEVCVCFFYIAKLKVFVEMEFYGGWSSTTVNDHAYMRTTPIRPTIYIIYPTLL